MKRKYEIPSMSELIIQSEDGFMAGSVFEPGNASEGVHIDGHEVGHEFDYSGQGSQGDTWSEQDNSWD